MIGIIRTGLAEYENLGSIVNCESFFSKLGVEFQAAQVRVRLEHCCQLKPEVAGKHPGFCNVIAPDDVFFFRAAKQLAVVFSGQRVAFRYPDGGAILAV